jgi:hypothetical protein
MGAYDLVLGMDWLKQFRPMVCDWLEKWIEFKHHGMMVRLQGMDTQQPQILQEVTVEQVNKWEKGNDLWAAVLLEPSPQPSSMTDQYLLNGIPTTIKDLIAEFGNIFQTPSTLPPSRLYDHSISLLPNDVPVNRRPYRYSHEQKTKIERQVAAMLQSGIIVPSLSPFASLVLLVKKR